MGYTSRKEELLRNIEEKLCEIPYIDKLMAIQGIGLVAVSGFIAEVRDIGHFDNPKQLQKLVDNAIVANKSGKHNGENRIRYKVPVWDTYPSIRQDPVKELS